MKIFDNQDGEQASGLALALDMCRYLIARTMSKQVALEMWICRYVFDSQNNEQASGLNCGPGNGRFQEN